MSRLLERIELIARHENRSAAWPEDLDGGAVVADLADEVVEIPLRFVCSDGHDHPFVTETYMRAEGGQVSGPSKVDARCRDRIPRDIVSRVRSTCSMSSLDVPVATCATEADVNDLVSLRVAMFVEFGASSETVARAEWRRAAEGWFRASLTSPVVRVAVVRVANRVVSCGVAQLRHDIPSPLNPGGRVAYVNAVMTRADCRGLGYARAVMTSLDEWAVEMDAGRLELFATHQGRLLYESMGYAVHGEPSMRRRLG